jgi:hypothetical protein
MVEFRNGGSEMLSLINAYQMRRLFHLYLLRFLLFKIIVLSATKSTPAPTVP